MKKKLLIGIIVVLGMAALAFMATTIAGAGIVVWVCLIWMVRKKKTNIFHDQMEPELAERRLKMLKVLLLVAGIALVVAIVGVILHNALSALSGTEEQVWFWVALVALYAFVAANTGGLIVFIKGRRKQDKGIPK